LVCPSVGGFYYFYVPKTYEAKATIEMATVADEPVEITSVFLGKMMLP
jgi:hypothetical protein